MCIAADVLEYTSHSYDGYMFDGDGNRRDFPEGRYRVDAAIGAGAIIFRVLGGPASETPTKGAIHSVGRIINLYKDGPVFRWRIPSPSRYAAPVDRAGAPTRTFGRSRTPCTGPSRRLRVSEEVIAAVKLEMITMLTNIHTSPTTRPPKVIGALSP